MPSFNGRRSVPRSLEAFAIHVANQHAARLAAQGLTSGRYTVDAPGGGTVTSIIYESGLREIIGTDIPALVEDSRAGRPIDYFSGFVFGGNLNVKSDLQKLLDYGAEKDPPPKTVTLLYSFYPENECVAKFPPHELTDEERLQDPKDRTYYDGFTTPFVPTQVTKLAVETHLDMADTVPYEYTGNASTYSHIRPTMFTGSMRKAVQFLMGVGKVMKPTWYAPVPGSQSEGFMYTNRDDYNEFTTGDEAHQLRYDFRYAKCHGLFKEQTVDGFKWWLVQVSQATGVIAMPLPLDAVSTSPAFRDALADLDNVKQDLHVLDTFGGFPSGAPMEAQTEAYIRAGVYVKLVDIAKMDEYSFSQPWGTQVGWSFSYDGAVAKCVAYQDIELGPAPNGYVYMCRAVSDMVLGISIKSTEPLVPSAQAVQAKNRMLSFLKSFTETDEMKPWRLLKLDRLSETQGATLNVLLDNLDASTEKRSALLNTFEMMECAPIATSQSTFTVAGRWSFSPPVTLFKTAHLGFDMCPSVDVPTLRVITAYGKYRVPLPGEKIPLHHWFTETGEEKTIWYDTGETGTYYNHISDTEVTFTARAPSCYVDKQPLTQQAKDVYPDPYLSYKSGEIKNTASGTSAANDTTPEGHQRINWMLTRQTSGKNDGGPSFADIEYGSAYMVLGDNEAALEFTYRHHAAQPAHTQHYSLGTCGDAYAYDWAYEFSDNPGVPEGGRLDMSKQIGYFITCGLSPTQQTPGGGIYCALPDTSLEYLSTDTYKSYFDFPNLTLARNSGPWAKPLGRRESLSGPPPDVPADENNPGDAAWSSMTSRVYAGKGVVSEFVDPTYVPRGQAFFDVLELQRSMYRPPPESPYVEHEVRGTSNAFGDRVSGGYMQAVNNYQYTVIGDLLHANQTGDMPCYVGVLMKPQS